MGRLAGIIYPHPTHVGNTIKPMLQVFEAFVESHEYYTYNFDVIQMGQIKHEFCSNVSKTIFCAVDGEVSPDTFIQNYEIHGPHFLQHIEGEFAFCLYDQKNKRLLLGRDRIGKKPLYWFQDAHHFLFASELKSLLVTGMVPQTAALDGIAAYLALGYFPQDLTPIEKVNKLLPGYYLCVEEDRSIQVRPFWSLSSQYSKETTETKEEISTHLKSLIEKSVQKQVPKKGKMGCYVSGGLGSASIAYFLKQTAPQDKLMGLTSGFSGQNEEDVDAAREYCKRIEIKQEINWITPHNFLDDIVSIIWQLDEPLADPNIIATWHLAKLGRGKGVLFSGMGSDELLAGHNRYTILERYVPPFNRFWSDVKKKFKKGMIPLLRIIQGDKSFQFLKHAQVNPYLEQYVVQNQIFSFSHFKSLSPICSALFDPDLFLQKFHNISRIPSIVSACTYLDMKTRLPDQYILQFDRLTAGFGLDWRAPYLDSEMIEYAVSIPEPEAGESESSTYLKRLFMDYFPKELVERPKRTRRSFMNNWVNISDLQDLFPLLKDGTLVNTGLISREWLDKMCEREETMESAFRYLFSVFILEIWFRLYINRPFTVMPPNISVKDLLLEP